MVCVSTLYNSVPLGVAHIKHRSGTSVSRSISRLRQEVSLCLSFFIDAVLKTVCAGAKALIYPSDSQVNSSQLAEAKKN